MNRTEQKEVLKFIDYLQDKVDVAYKNETDKAINRFKKKISNKETKNISHGMSKERRMIAKARLSHHEYASGVETMDVNTKALLFEDLLKKLGTVLEINQG